MRRSHLTLLRFLSATILALFSSVVLRALPVVPGAVGFGTDTPAGRGGIVYRVTNLDNSGPGSLRFGIEDASMRQPRVIVFEVSGVIELQSDLVIRDDSFGAYSHLTIAGQTAPHPGITLKNFGISIRSHDILIQHIAIRPGNLVGTQGQLDNRDAIKIETPAGVTVRNIVLDHVSCSWSVDEMASLWGANGAITNVTFLNSIFASPIMNGEPDASGHSRLRTHSEGTHAFGPLSGPNTSNVSMIRNILAFNYGRNPAVANATSGAQIINNLIYRPSPWPNGVIRFDNITVAPHQVSVIGNAIIRHPTPFVMDITRLPDPTIVDPQTLITTPTDHPTFYGTGIYISDNVSANAAFYLADNRLLDPQTNTWLLNEAIVRDRAGTPVIRLPADPYANSGGTTWTPWASADVEANLVLGAGKFPAHRDPIDAELIGEILDRENPLPAGGTFLERFSDLGADPWAPANAQNHRPLDTPANAGGDDDGDGYTNLEEWLHQMAAAVETAVNLPPIANAGPDQTVVVHGDPSAAVMLDGRASYDLNGDALTYAWTWPGGSATGATPMITLPVGETVVTLVVTDADGTTGSDTVKVTVVDVPPPVALGDLNFTYSGQPKPATVVTFPEDLAVEVRYDGSLTPPTLPGSYEVVATVVDPAFSGTATGTLVIAPTAFVRHAPTIDGVVDGSVQVLLAENVTLNSTTRVSGDLLVPGTPSIQINGTPTYGGTVDSAGAASPTTHRVTLNGGTQLRNVVRRVDPPVMTVVPAPPAPSGTRNVSLNQAGQSPGDFATLRNLTLNSGVGSVDVPPGTYGDFTANSNSGFRFGVVGATEPTIYHLQSLTLNSGSQLQIVGPVVLTVASSVIVNNASVGAAAHPGWLALRVAAGGVTLNGAIGFHGVIAAPSGTVSLNGGAQLAGRVVADRLTVNSSAALRHTADATPPTIAITSPADGATVKGVVTIAAQAADERGVVGVQFRINGENLGAEDRTSPFAIAWNTVPTTEGDYTLTAMARDREGNTATSAPVNVTIANAVFDTFENGSADGWVSDGGSWSVSSDAGSQVYRQTNPGLTAVRSVRADTLWTDQVVEADVTLRTVSGTNRFFGVLARHGATPNNYYYLVLRTNNSIELKRIVNNVAANVAPPVTGFPVTVGTTYRLRLEVIGSTLKGYVNDELKIQGTDTTFASGSAGLLTFFSDVAFDDVHIDPTPISPVLSADDFEDGNADSWTTPAGAWSVASGGGGHFYRQTDASGAALALVGGSDWSRQIVEVDARPLSFAATDAWIGCVARYVDADNHYAVVVRDGGSVELRKIAGGVVTTLASEAVPVAVGTAQTLRLTAIGESLKVYLNSRLLLQAVDTTFPAGAAGLATSAATAEFDDWLVIAP
ncbi:MAG TPA: MBG domain-containing protein [Opitutaceae bacterium]